MLSNDTSKNLLSALLQYAFFFLICKLLGTATFLYDSLVFVYGAFVNFLSVKCSNAVSVLSLFNNTVVMPAGGLMDSTGTLSP